MTRLSIDFTDEQEVASLYHSGQNSMLYAVASTGFLRCGTLSDNTVAAFRDLVERLQSEASDAADIAEEEATNYCFCHAYDLREIEAKCESWLDTHSEE